MSNLEPITGQHFAYAFGRTGVLQQLLLTQSDIDRLLGAHDRKDAENILTELKLTSMVDQSLRSAEQVTQALEAWVRNEVEMMSPKSKQPVFQILWLNGDSARLSYLLKKHHSLTSNLSKEPESGLSAYDPESLRTLVETGRESSLPEHLVSFVQEMRDASDLTPQKIDARVAQFIASVQLCLARTSGSALIKRYVTHTIDLRNIRIALRNYSEVERENALIEGGSIPTKDLMGDRNAVLASVQRSPLPFELAESIQSVGEDPIALERTCADVLAKDIADMWNIPMSIEPLFAFASIALGNIFLLRTIVIGKSNDLSPQDLKKILPPFTPALHYLS